MNIYNKENKPCHEDLNSFREYSGRIASYKSSKMPVLKFPEGMTVQPIPTFGGAIARFFINGYSVYYDAYGMLGAVDEPYWEVYDGDDLHRFSKDEWPEMLRFIKGMEERR